LGEIGATTSAARNLATSGPSSIQVTTPAALAQTESMLQATSVLYGTPESARLIEMPAGGSRHSVSGRVLLALQEPTQPADFDPWRWVAVPAWGLILFLLPPTAVLAVWQAAGLLPAVAIGVVFLALLRFIFSGRLLQSWELIALHGRHVIEPMPVTMLRVRTMEDREVQVRLKGHLQGGSTAVGDRVAVQGRWRHNVLQASRLQCERTGAFIIPIQPCGFRSAMSGSLILLCMALWLSFAGVPWFQQQYAGFSGDLQRQLNSVTLEKPAYTPAHPSFTAGGRTTP